jgi:predicted ATPase/DNA-binding XRE family transcriptional regulator
MSASNASHITNVDFPVFLKQRRRDLDLTRAELAQRVGCSTDTIKKLEEGERRPSKELAELLADHLQIDLTTRAAFIALARARSTSNGELGPSNLPAALTSFVGRESEVDSIESILRKGDVRLLTLIGPPGVGKSRLAVRAADRLRPLFPDGTWFVPLAAIEDPQQVPLLISQTLGIAENGLGSPLDWLTTALHNRRLLLLLDNFEQIIEAALLITRLLTACSQVVALITSRTAIEVYGEHQFSVPPLPIPPPATWSDPRSLSSYDAVQLFVARIRAHNPSFQLTAENGPALAELCARLDGIPLAIELAAGLTRAESPHLLLTDVAREGRLALLTTTQRDRTPRQQTLREAIAWSVRRLSVPDQRLFARLGVFYGTFDLAAAQAVASIDDSGTTSAVAIDFAARLQALVASHLVQLQVSEDVTRYNLLETLREYALEMLQATGEIYATQQRHAQHFATLALAIDPAQAIGNLHAWRDQVRPDFPNLLAALQFALAAPDTELALQLANGLGHFWYLEGNWQEGANWLTQALALSGGPLALRARANTELGILYSALGRYAEAEQYLTQANQEATQAGDLLATAWTLSQLGQVALLQGQASVTRAYTYERLQIYRRLGDIRYLAITLEQMGCAAVEEGDYERGVPWLEECLELWDAQGSRSGVAATLCIIGMADLAQGNTTIALSRFQKAYEEFEAIQHSHGLPWVLRNLGLAHLALGQLPQAQFHLTRSLERYTALASSDGSIAIVEATAGIAARQGDHTLAAHLIGAATTARVHTGLGLTVNSRQIYDRLLAPSIKALGQARWDEAIAVGTTLPWTEAVVTARKLITP